MPRTAEEIAAARLLTCSSCGAHPNDDEARYNAVVGGPHSRRIQHGFGAPGRKSTPIARTCGKWKQAEVKRD